MRWFKPTPRRSTGPLSESEIARRTPVWVALSDLFLDTEMQDFTRRHIAETIERATYSIAEAEAILRDEVAPVFFVTLLSVAGEWAGWSDAYVRDTVLEHLRARQRRWSLLARLRRRNADRTWRIVAPDWEKIKRLLAKPGTPD